jgi:hypothetical protein
VWFFNNVMYFLLLLFSGANIPRGDMPQWMVVIGDFLPLTRSIEAARRVTDGAGFGDISSLLAMELRGPARLLTKHSLANPSMQTSRTPHRLRRPAAKTRPFAGSS